MNEKIRLCHLYPDLLNLYGDRGNILSLVRRASLRGIEITVEGISINDHFDPDRYDIIFLGGGQDNEQKILRNDFVVKKGSSVRRAVERNKVFLCICGGFQMMGKYYEEHGGKRIECLGALDIWTIGHEERFIGNTIYQCDLLKDEVPMDEPEILYGFENHSGRTFLGDRVDPLAKVVKGFGNNGQDKTEGAIYKNVFCTYSHGSFLPKNPAMTDFLIKRSLSVQKQDDVELTPLGTEIEDFARKTIKSCN